MTYQEKKDAVLKWLSLSGYGERHSEFIVGKLSMKYPEVNWAIDLPQILAELLSENLIQYKEGVVLIFEFPSSNHTQRIEKSYKTTLDGDAYVQRLPGIEKEDNEDAVIELIDLLLRYLPQFGFFDKSFLITEYIPTTAEKIFEIVQYDFMWPMFFNYIIRTGFAIQRADIKYGNNLYIELTENGRKLKEIGSIAEYKLSQKVEKEKADKVDRDNETLRQTNLTNGKIQLSLLSINRWIALGGIVAAVYYLILMIDYYSKLIAQHLKLYYGASVTIFLLLLGAVIGVCLTKGWQQWRKYIKKKVPNT